MIAVISWNRGVEYVSVREKSIKIPKFIDFLRKLRKRFYYRKLAIFFDGMSVHRSKKVKTVLDQLKMPYVFNAPYSPAANGIEFAFAKVKNYFKRRKLNEILNK